MTILAGRFQDIIKEKLQKIIELDSKRVSTEKIMLLLNQMYAIQHNPAYRAAMVVALKNSHRIDDFLKEYNNPSFDLPGVENIPYDDKPAKFTSYYQLYEEFVDVTETQETSVNLYTYDIEKYTLTKDNNPFAKIIYVTNWDNGWWW